MSSLRDAYIPCAQLCAQAVPRFPPSRHHDREFLGGRLTLRRTNAEDPRERIPHLDAGLTGGLLNLNAASFTQRSASRTGQG
jgi:hypothetical protein